MKTIDYVLVIIAMVSWVLAAGFGEMKEPILMLLFAFLGAILWTLEIIRMRRDRE